MRTAELSGAALNWAVAKCEGLLCFGYRTDGERFAIEDSDGQIEGFMPSANWAQGGAVIEREMIKLVPVTGALWEAYKRNQHIPSDGATPLIAAMRCYVASKLGDEVEIPDELFNHA
jgi:hypothetical protein